MGSWRFSGRYWKTIRCSRPFATESSGRDGIVNHVETVLLGRVRSLRGLRLASFKSVARRSFASLRSAELTGATGL